MQVTFNPINLNFKGSFKNINLDDMLPESDNWQRQKPQINLEQSPKELILTRKPSMKMLSCSENGVKTNVTLWESEKDAIVNNIPDNIKNLCKFHGINPKEDLFMISGINKDGQLFVIFNSFFRNEQEYQVPKNDNSAKMETKVAHVDCAQVYCMKSTDSNPTPLQLDIAKIFNDSRNKKYLMEGSTKNPLKTICNAGVRATEVFVPGIHALSCVSKDIPKEDLMDESGKINRVIYTADGKYTRYKIIYIPIK